MNRTIFDTPVIQNIMHRISTTLLNSSEWRVEGKRPDFKKYVIIGAPHTSNWDFICALVIAFSLKLKVHMMGKKELMRPPFGLILKWLGLIPIDRSRSHNTVASMVDIFNKKKELALVIAPSGTRKRVKFWKSGFYHIAYGAGVPIVLGYVDYPGRIGGLGPYIMPTGNIEADMEKIRSFYSGIRGRHPERSKKVPVINPTHSKI